MQRKLSSDLPFKRRANYVKQITHLLIFLSYFFLMGPPYKEPIWVLLAVLWNPRNLFLEKLKSISHTANTLSQSGKIWALKVQSTAHPFELMRRRVALAWNWALSISLSIAMMKIMFLCLPLVGIFPTLQEHWASRISPVFSSCVRPH